MTDKNTNDLHNGLQALQAQLEKLESASQQIDQVKDISASVIGSMATLQDKYASHLEALSIENKNFTERHEKLLKEQLNINKEATSKLVADTQSTLNQISNALNDNIEKSTKIQKENGDQISSHLTHYSEFVKKVEILTSTIQSVNFPNRLDKLDNTVSAINIGIQNLQTAQSTSEKNILEELKENKKVIESEFQASKEQIKSTKNILLIIGVISAVLLLVIMVKIFL